MSTSIFSRFTASVFGNALKSALTLLTGILLARGLGPSEYGVFVFLLASFLVLTQLLDMGSSNAFFTFISQKARSKRFYNYYFVWVLSQFVISILLISVIAPDSWIEKIWQGESRARVVFAFVAVFFQQRIWQMIAQIGESQRLTHRVQLLNILIGAVHLAVVAMLFWADMLGIELVYLVITVELLLATIVAYFVFSLRYSVDSPSFRQIFGEYKIYCLPLIAYGWVSVADGFANTWLLQRFGGSIEQAYYAVAMQFSAVSLLATRSILHILWKEIAEANSQKNTQRVLKLFNRATKLLFFSGALVTGFLIPWVTEIIDFTLGEAYLGGVAAMSIMFLYPVNQARGQVSGATFLALELTRPYVVIGILGMLASIVVAYFMLAPADAFVPGLGMGSTGMALKMVGLQFISVNVSIWWISRHLNDRFDWMYQFTGLGILLLFGYLAYFGVNETIGEPGHVVIRALLAALIYMAATTFVLYKTPEIFGMDRGQLDGYARALTGLWRGTVESSDQGGT